MTNPKSNFFRKPRASYFLIAYCLAIHTEHLKKKKIEKTKPRPMKKGFENFDFRQKSGYADLILTF